MSENPKRVSENPRHSAIPRYVSSCIGTSTNRELQSLQFTLITHGRFGQPEKIPRSARLVARPNSRVFLPHE